MLSEKERGDIRAGAVLRAYTRAAGKYPWLLGVALASSVGVQIAAVITPLYLKDIINIVATKSPSVDIWTALMVPFGFFVITQVALWIFQRISEFTLADMELRAMQDLYNAAFEKLLLHSHEFFISNFSGALTRRITRYARAFERIWDDVAYNAIPIAVYTIGTVAVLSMQNLVLGAGLFVWAAVFIILQIVLIQRLQPLRLAMNKADSVATGAVSDAVVNHLAITTFAALPHERMSFGDAVAKWRAAADRSWKSNLNLNSVFALLNTVVNIALLGAAIFYWQRGLLSAGDFLLIQMYVMGLINRIWGIGRNMRQLYDAFAEATEMLDTIERPLDIVDVSNARDLIVTDGIITFDHTRFGYHKGSTVLNDFNLTIAPHEKIALVGLSGAGKTTVTKLLLRLYDITHGAITIDGQNIAEVTQDSLRRAISFVPQEPMLFHRSLMENIRYGRPDATDEEVISAAKQAHCYEFISQYPDGFDTLVGERGVKLSGGERQRVAIARAILKNAPILVLDEATSSLDSESEHLIQDALSVLMEGKTVIAVAHRLSTIMKMGRIIVMEHGSITRTGTHAELLAHDENLYKKLWDIQAGGFITE